MITTEFDKLGLGGGLIVPLLYLQSDGNQYIKTDITAAGTDDFTMECDVVFDYKIANTIFMGTANYGSNGFILYSRNTSPTTITSEVSGTYANFQFGFDINTRYDIKLNIKSSNTSYKTTWINNTLYEDNIQCGGAISKSLPVYLFIGPYPNKNKAKMKFYGAKFYKDGVVTNDLRPVLHNDRPAMYDVITKKFYYNIGTGEFSYELV